MKCPYCKKEAKISDVVKLNLEAYGRTAKARTRCCGALIVVYPIIAFGCYKTEQKGKDDWGE